MPKIIPIKILLRMLERQGFRIRQGKASHKVVFCPCGKHSFVLSMNEGKSGDTKNIKNTLARLRNCPLFRED